jgi:riboflavin kinase / FMN adenylyltransferase
MSSSTQHLAIGVFDGLHLGHRAVVTAAQNTARDLGGSVGLLTFRPHPAKVLRPELAPQLLMGRTLRSKVLADWGVPEVTELAFDAEFASQPPEGFVAQLRSQFPQLATISVGRDWKFGYQRRGDVAFLQKSGFRVNGIAPVTLDGETVSSTRIRKLVSQGELAAASKLLGRPYSLAGEVVNGRRLARKLGFPTANVALEVECLPPQGVYAVQVLTQSAKYAGVANLGRRPTVETGEVAPSLEAHLFDFAGDLYGQTLEVQLTRFLRAERRLGSLEELQQQIGLDVQQARQVQAQEA